MLVFFFHVLNKRQSKNEPLFCRYKGTVEHSLPGLCFMISDRQEINSYLFCQAWYERLLQSFKFLEKDTEFLQVRISFQQFHSFKQCVNAVYILR